MIGLLILLYASGTALVYSIVFRRAAKFEAVPVRLEVVSASDITFRKAA